MKKLLDKIKSKCGQWWPSLKPVAIAAGLALLLSVSGCSGLLIHQSLTKGDVLTPEQIAAYEKVGSKAFSCFTIAGPPPGGNLVLMTVPKDAAANVKFGPGCQILMQ